MEQTREIRDRKWVKVREEKAKAGVDEEVVLQKARAVIVCAPVAVKRQPINRAPHVMSSNAPSAEPS
jgi:hypothetical protein